jgi:hypothetical protein
MLLSVNKRIIVRTRSFRTLYCNIISEIVFLILQHRSRDRCRSYDLSLMSICLRIKIDSSIFSSSLFLYLTISWSRFRLTSLIRLNSWLCSSRKRRDSMTISWKLSLWLDWHCRSFFWWVRCSLASFFSFLSLRAFSFSRRFVAQSSCSSSWSLQVDSISISSRCKVSLFLLVFSSLSFFSSCVLCSWSLRSCDFSSHMQRIFCIVRLSSSYSHWFDEFSHTFRTWWAFDNILSRNRIDDNSCTAASCSSWWIFRITLSRSLRAVFRSTVDSSSARFRSSCAASSTSFSLSESSSITISFWKLVLNAVKR